MLSLRRLILVGALLLQGVVLARPVVRSIRSAHGTYQVFLLSDYKEGSSLDIALSHTLHLS